MERHQHCRSIHSGRESTPRLRSVARVPPIGRSHEPREAITHKLKSLINSHGYGEAFEAAIQHVSQQGISELDRVQSLDQFYFWLDAMATWIPELRVWGWDGGTDHERTDDLRITQFYYYFNQPQLLALQSPIDPNSDGSLTPLSAWLREYVITYGRFLDTPESATRLHSYKHAADDAYQDDAGGEDGIRGAKALTQAADSRPAARQPLIAAHPQPPLKTAASPAPALPRRSAPRRHPPLWTGRQAAAPPPGWRCPPSPPAAD